MATNGLNLQTSGLTFATGTVDRMIIDASGQFGFGTIAPSTDYHVLAAGVRFEGLPVVSSTNFMVMDGSGVVGTRSDIAVGTVVTDVTEASNVVTVAYNDIADTTFTIDALTSVAYDTSWGIAQSGTGTVSGNFELPFITSGSYNSGTGTITLSINGGLESDIEITGLDGADTFVTGGTINSPASGTLRLTRNDGANVDVTGFQWGTTGDQGTSTMYNGDRLNILGGTGISTIDDGSLTIRVNLDDTAVTPGTYGSASETVTFTVDQQGRLTAASEQAIAITASQVTDFDSEVLSSVFEAANFVDSAGAAGIDFTVSAGASVTASLVNSSIGVVGTTGTNSDINLGSSLTFTSSDGSIVATGNGSGTLDLTVDASSVSDSFVTGATLGSGTLTLSLSNGKPDVTASGFGVVVAGDDDSSTVNLGSTISVLGTAPISTAQNAGAITVSLDDTAVTAGSYGAADTVATFTVDDQGRLTAAADASIDITASQVSDFDTEVLSSVFEVANFVDSSEIDFGVTAGASVSAELIDGSIGNARLVNDSLTFAGTAGTDSEVDLGGTLTFTSSDSSAIITAGGAADTIDITVDGSVTSQNIYNIDGTLSGARTVTQAGNLMRFSGGDFEAAGGVFHVDNVNNNVGIGSTTPVVSAALEVSSTTQGFLFPRMTSAQRLAIGSPATGLMVYQTDSREGVYIYKSFGWVQVI